MDIDSIMTLSCDAYREVDVVFRLVVALSLMLALLLCLSTMCVSCSGRFPLILASVSLGGAFWFEAGITRSWQAAFELAGSSYCVTGLPLADGERRIAWSLAVPSMLFCLGLSQSEGRGPFIRILGMVALLTAVLAPLSPWLQAVGLLCCMVILRGLWMLPAAGTSLVAVWANRIGVAALLLSLLLAWEAEGRFTSLGSTAETVLVRGETLRGISDILGLAIPAAALLVIVLHRHPRKGS